MTSETLVSSTGSVDVPPHPAHDDVRQQTDGDPAAGGDREVPSDGQHRHPAATAPSAVRKATRAVASLSRDSPSSTVTIRRGIPTRRAMASAATASGGATTAPSAKAAGQVTPGSTVCTARPTPTAVKPPARPTAAGWRAGWR